MQYMYTQCVHRRAYNVKIDYNITNIKISHFVSLHQFYSQPTTFKKENMSEQSETQSQILEELQEMSGKKIVKPKIENKNQNLLMFLFMLQEHNLNLFNQYDTIDKSSLVQKLLESIQLTDLTDPENVNAELDRIFWSRSKEYRKLMQQYINPPKRAVKKAKEAKESVTKDAESGETEVKEKKKRVTKKKTENTASSENAVEENTASSENAVEENTASSENAVEENEVKVEEVKEKKKRVSKKKVEPVVTEVVEESAASKENAVEESAASKENAVEESAASKENAVEESAASKENAVEESAASKENAVEENAAKEPPREESLKEEAVTEEPKKKAKVVRKKREEKDKINVTYEEDP